MNKTTLNKTKFSNFVYKITLKTTSEGTQILGRCRLVEKYINRVKITSKKPGLDTVGWVFIVTRIE